MQPLTFEYVNYRGEVSFRSVNPGTVYWGSTEYHPEPQWLMEAFDLDKNEVRVFAMKDMRQTPRPGWKFMPYEATAVMLDAMVEENIDADREHRIYKAAWLNAPTSMETHNQSQAMQDRIRKLEAALKPFADIGSHLCQLYGSGVRIGGSISVKADMFQEAADVLAH